MTHKNVWFKHYNTASQGATLRTLWDNGDFEAYGMWWRLLELISVWENEDSRGEITISWNVLGRDTGWKPTKCRRVLFRIASVSNLDIKELPDGNVSFLHPNWLELQERRGGKKEAKEEQKNSKEGVEVRGKKKDIRDKKLDLVNSYEFTSSELSHAQSLDVQNFQDSLQEKTINTLAGMGIKTTTLKSWLSAYPEPSFLDEELFKSLAWLEVNPRRRPKHFAKFFGNWLAKGWENRRKQIPTNRPGAITSDWEAMAKTIEGAS